MKTQNNEQKKSNENTNFLMVLDNIKRCKGLDWKEKALLSNYISFLRDGKEFFQTDEFQAKELGLSPAQISKFTGRLKERGEIATDIKYVENANGGRPVPKRYVKVLDIDKWAKGDTTPVVNRITPPNKKKMAREVAANKNEKPIIKDDVTGPIIPNKLNQVDSKPLTPSATTTSQPKEKVLVLEKKPQILAKNIAVTSAVKNTLPELSWDAVENILPRDSVWLMAELRGQRKLNITLEAFTELYNEWKLNGAKLKTA
jgi:hypothetical protein